MPKREKWSQDANQQVTQAFLDTVLSLVCKQSVVTQGGQEGRGNSIENIFSPNFNTRDLNETALYKQCFDNLIFSYKHQN